MKELGDAGDHPDRLAIELLYAHQRADLLVRPDVSFEFSLTHEVLEPLRHELLLLRSTIGL
jgi:hypothetical protein